MSFTTKKPTAKLFTGTSRILAIPDLHAPYHNCDTLKFLKEVRDEVKPTMVIQLGDLVDQHTMGRFDPEPDAAGTCEELEDAREFIKKLGVLFPTITVTLGNHDLRVLKRAKKNGIPSVWMREISDVYGAPSTWKFTGRIVIDGIEYFHGDGFTGQLAAVRAAESHRSCTVIGHVHAGAGIVYSAGPNDQIWGMNAGCLIDKEALAFAYGRDFVKKPVLGCAVVLGGVPHFLPLR